MIYIRCLFNGIRSNFAKTILIIFFAASSATFLSNRQKGLDLIGLSADSNLPRISFVTSLDGNIQELKNKIIILPGVKRVDHKDSNTIKETISLLFKSDVLEEVISNGPGYSKYTIHFKPNITTKAVNLIKSYVIKILSGDEVYFGKLQGMKKKSEFDQNHLFYFIYGLGLLILLGLYSVFDFNLRKLTYLFQRFQRGKGLGYKVSFLSFFSLIILPTFMILVFFNAFQIKNIIAFLVPSTIFFFILNVKRYRWLS